MEMIAALLPMKGHSERVPNKNMRSFAGNPLFHTIIKSLLEVPLISTIVINTDSEIIKEDAIKNFGEKIKVISRPNELCGDFVSMNDIIAYDLTQLNEYNYFIQTHSTNPLLSVNSIKNACNFFLENINNYDSIFSVTRIQTRLYSQEGKPVNHNPNQLIRTQDLPPLFEENSNFYIFSKKSFLQNKNQRIGTKPYMYELNKLEAIDIDEEEDFILAETLYKTFPKE
jgi:N-acylneuraminate cytidylyltransferase